MEVMVVNWNDIPRRHWEDVLALIPKGDYIKELPYEVKSPCLRIPLSVTPLFDINEVFNIEEISRPQFEYLEFTQFSGVWQRTN